MRMDPGLHPFIPQRPQGEIILPRPPPANVTEKPPPAPAPGPKRKSDKVAKIVGGVVGGYLGLAAVGLGWEKYGQMKKAKVDAAASQELSDAYNRIAPLLAKGGGQKWRKTTEFEGEIFHDAVSDIS